MVTYILFLVNLYNIQDVMGLDVVSSCEEQLCE